MDHAATLFLHAWPTEGPRLPSRATIKCYRLSIEWLVAFARRKNKLLVTDLTPELLRAATRVRMEHTGDRAPHFKGGEALANQLVAATRALARWLLAAGVPVHDLSVVRPPRVPERIQPRMRPDEFRRVEAAILRRLLSDERDARITVARDMAIINVLTDTGLRANELCSLKLDSLDLEQGWIEVWGKGGKPRALSIRDPEERDGGSTLKLLRQWIEARASIPGAMATEALWLNPKGQPVSTDMLRRLLARACTQAGLIGTRPPHSFRRGSFTEMYEQAMYDPQHAPPMPIVVARMGWSKKSHAMVDVYTRGAEIELARMQPVPLVSKRWRQSPNGPMSSARGPSIVDSAGLLRGTVDDAAPATRGRATGSRAARRTS